MVSVHLFMWILIYHSWKYQLTNIIISNDIEYADADGDVDLII